MIAASGVRSQEPATYAARQAPQTDEEIIARASEILHATLERGDAMSDPRTVGMFLSAKLAKRHREVFAVMFMDTRHRLIAFEELFAGSLDGAEVHPREVARAALVHNAACVILAHNHPSGNPEPSAADRAVTARLKQALALLDVRLLDHFIIGDGPALSMAARGYV